MNNYDVIVIGSGNSGLLSALSLKVDGYNVLLLEANNNVGGLSKSIVKGRFEFNNILHSLFLKNKTTDRFRIDNVFSKCKIEDELRFSPLPELCRIITPNADYRENTEVITSYWLKNSYSDDYTPAEDVSIKFCVYKGSNLIYSYTKTKAIVPGNDINHIYFKWKVPIGFNNADVKITAEIIDDGASYNNYSNK